MKKEQQEVEIVSELPEGVKIEKQDDIKAAWKPKTTLGKKIRSGEVTDIKEILDHGLKILEPEIVDFLLPNIESELILVGQSKGKFGGGKRSIWRQTQKKTKEGNKPTFATVIAVGNKQGYLGVGHGKAKETVPAREKAMRKAKLNLMSVKMGCGAWACNCKEQHSIPITVNGRCGSARITLIPAPRGTGLKTEKEVQKLLRLAGIKDIYSKTFGQTRTKLNLIYACLDALQKLNKLKLARGKNE